MAIDPAGKEDGVDVTVTAYTPDAICYTKTLTGKEYEFGNIYNVGWRMNKTGYDLSKVTGNLTLQNGDVVTGTLAGNYKVSIAHGATVTLDGVNINGLNNAVNSIDYSWAGITCEGNATIILKDGTENTVKGFHENYPGIYVPQNKTLIIQGTGSLNASSGDVGDDQAYAAGIGAGYQKACGNIEIQGGTITATGGYYAAGIGGGDEASCGTITISSGTITAMGGYWAAGIGIGSGNNETCGAITITGGIITATGGYWAAGIGNGFNGGSCGTISISGGTVTATGGSWAAGIGSGFNGTCGDITITSGVTKVTATKGSEADHSIGAGNGGSCGTVTIGGTKYWENNAYVGDGETYLKTSPLVYQP